jgi:hypothetical protein
MKIKNKGYNRVQSGCERISCPFYKWSEKYGHECGDKDEHISIRDGELICRFNKDAVENMI